MEKIVHWINQSRIFIKTSTKLLVSRKFSNFFKAIFINCFSDLRQHGLLLGKKVHFLPPRQWMINDGNCFGMGAERKMKFFLSTPIPPGLLTRPRAWSINLQDEVRKKLRILLCYFRKIQLQDPERVKFQLAPVTFNPFRVFFEAKTTNSPNCMGGYSYWIPSGFF